MRQLPEQCESCKRRIATLETCIFCDGTRRRDTEVTFQENAEGGIRCVGRAGLYEDHGLIVAYEIGIPLNPKKLIEESFKPLLRKSAGDSVPRSEAQRRHTANERPPKISGGASWARHHSDDPAHTRTTSPQ